jgi:hypothetical protein
MMPPQSASAEEPADEAAESPSEDLALAEAFGASEPG